MTVKELIESLQDLPSDYQITLSNYMVLNEKEGLECRLDIPTCGLVAHDGMKEAFICIGSGKKTLDNLCKNVGGKIHPI